VWLPVLSGGNGKKRAVSGPGEVRGVRGGEGTPDIQFLRVEGGPKDQIAWGILGGCASKIQVGGEEAGRVNELDVKIRKKGTIIKAA